MLDRRNRRLERSIVLLVLIVLVVAATAVYAFLQLRVDQVSSFLKNKLPMNVLFIVSEKDKPLFFEVFLYNPETRKGAVFNVPTNLGGVIESLKRVDAIDALYKRGNPDPVVKKIESLLGVRIQCVIDVSRSDVSRLVDLIGGLVLFIPNPVDVTWEGRRILLPSGSVVLDGDKIVDFISYEDPLEQETDKVSRKQKFIQALLKGFGENNQYLQNRATFRALRSFIRTTLAPRALGSLITEMGKFDPERMVLQRVLGNGRMVDGRELLFPHQDGDLLKEAVKQTLEANSSSEFVPSEDLTITVEVLNGTKTPGMAARARELFQSFDMDVLSVGNADTNAYDATVVLDRKGRLEDAKKVADIIKCTQVFSRPDVLMDQAVEVTVILGKDFDGRYCKQ
jgi:anionic cell wall polymer biosynthesis LytR-Cps2A-Psr (LCP) family protein